MYICRRASVLAVGVSVGAVVALTSARPSARQAPAAAQSQQASAPQAVLSKYCITCHNQKARVGGLALDTLDASNPGPHADVWERVVEKLRAGSMPPPGRPRPDAATYLAVATELEVTLDRAWAAHPDPGRIGAVHRLNRTEYANAIRDLFGLDSESLDVVSQLPGDETADGSFDNFADSLSISTAHLERYMSVARQVTRLATALPPPHPAVEMFEIPLHVTQDDRQQEELPLGSRGGIAVRYHFPVDGEYRIVVKLQRNYQDYLKGMGWEQQLDVRLDGKLLKRFAVGGKGQGRPAAASYAGDGEPGFAGAPEWERYMQLDGDANLEVRVPVTAGSRTVGVSFVRELWEPEGLPQPLQRGRVITNDEVYMDYANVAAVQIGGPYAVDAPAGKKNTDRVFTCRPSRVSEESACATRILSRLARLAYRRPVNKADVQVLMSFFAEGRRAGSSFESGVQFALERMLVDPDFLLRVYRDPAARPRRVGVQPVASVETYRLSDLELASRLSFFIWSSIPDDQLLTLAEQRKLSDPAILDQQVKRMLADPRGIEALVDDFAAQWLNLRRVAEVVRRSGAVPELRPDLDGVVQAGDRAVCGEHAARRPERAGAAERRLHVRERKAREALRHSRNLRQPFPPCDARRQEPARRTAGPGRAPVDDVVSRQDVARAPRQIPAEQHLRLADFAAAGWRRHEPRADQAGRAAADDSRATGAAPHQPDLRELSWRHRSAGLRARELRRHRRVADDR
jgi:mono/diheme cytochrome c family protein